MREIEFRGISVDTNKFEYGLLVFMCGVGGWAIEQSFDTPPTMSDPCGSSDYKRHEIKNDTQGQFTGLKDKNGKKIFEGDIVQPYSDDKLNLAQIIYINGSFKVATKNKNSDYLIWNYMESEIEIIGNIHQNKDFLK